MTPAAPRKVYFVSLGCPKNRVDSEVMLGAMDQAGHRLVTAPDEAEVIVVNTCGFIDAAKEESIDTILEMAQYKSEGACKKLVVTGCLTQRYPDEVAREIPEIDHILGSADYQDIARVVGELAPKRKKLPVLEVSETPAYLYDHTAPRVITGPRFSVYVKIAEGCDRPCAFCIIPKLRGPQRSRTIESVVAEVTQLVAGGAREVNLVAQDLTRYGWDLPERPTLAALLRAVCTVDGLRWVRLHYTYPSAFTDELIDVIAAEEKVVKYIDVPLQHIDDRMLKIMRRGHSARVTHELIERLRARVPDVVLRSTFIVGHPGETDEMFDGLCSFVEGAALDRVGVFTYSKEPGTVSAMLPHRVAATVMAERQARLMELQRQVSRRKNQAMVGRTIEVLVEGESDESELLLQGRWYGQAPEIDGSVYLADGTAQPGDLVRARHRRVGLRPGGEHDCVSLVRTTPILFGALGPSIGLKLENLQRTGSFKLRGAVRLVAALSPAERRAGLVTASAGNHGAGLALACREASVPLTVVVPEGAPEVKRAAIAAAGATVVIRGATYDEAESAARKMGHERGVRFGSAFDDEHVVEGNGSDLAREILEQVPDLARVVAPVGGGGLIGGLGRVLAPRRVDVVGVQPEVNCAMFESLRGGAALTRYAGRPTIAEGCEGAVAEMTFDLARRHVREVALVSEAAIRRAVAWLYRVAGTIAEPTGAVAVAGFLSGAVAAADHGRTVAVVSGGNIDPGALDRILHTELVGLS